MKVMKKLLVGMMALVMSLSISAQQPCHHGAEGGCQKGKEHKCCKMMKPEERAGFIAERFNLDESKKEALLKFYKDEDVKRQKEMIKRAKEEDARKAKMKKELDKSDKKLGKIIGAENLKALQQEREERMKAFQKHHNDKAHRGHRPEMLRQGPKPDGDAK